MATEATPVTPPAPRPEAQEPRPGRGPGGYLSQRVQAVPPSGIRRFFDVIATMPDVISLGVGEPDFTTPPQIVEEGVRSLRSGRTHYTSNYGTLDLRRALASHLEQRYGLSYDPEGEIIVTVGASEAVAVAMAALIDPGDEVILHEPSYVAYLPAIIFNGGVPRLIPTRLEDEFQLDPEAVAAAVTPRTKMIFLGYPCNPTGAVLDEPRLRAIAEIAARHDLVEGIVKVHQYEIMSAPTMAQDAAVAALKGAERDVERMVREYDRRRRMFVDGLNRIGLPTFEPRGAFYAFPNIAGTGLTSAAFSERLLFEQQVAVVPGDAFGPSGEGHVRACYATSYEGLEEALVRIERFLGSL